MIIHNMVLKHHLSENVPIAQNDFDGEADNLVSLFGFDIHTDNNNNMVNGYPLAVQHMSQKHNRMFPKTQQQQQYGQWMSTCSTAYVTTK